MNSEINPELWLFKDDSTNIVFDGLLGFIHTFRHPAFFVISGFVTYKMFQKYSVKEVINKRFKRLFIPMLITIILMAPVVQILLALIMGQSDVYSLAVIFPPTTDQSFSISTIYVWFLYYLLLFSAVHIVLEKLGLSRFLERIKIGKNWFFTTLLILLLAIMGCLSAWNENSLFGQYYLLPELGSVAGYFAFYLFGVFLSSRKNSLSEIKKHGLLFVLLGTMTFVIYSLVGMGVLAEGGTTMKFNLTLMICSSLATVFYSFGFLGLALKYYKKPIGIITYVSRSSYFLYLIHFPILLVFLRFSVLQDWNVFVKFLFILIATCIVSAILNVLWLKLWRNKPPI